MARKGVNSVWLNEMRDKLNAIDTNGFNPVILSYNTAAQWLIANIAKMGYTPKVENLGAGVKRISITGTCCKTCGQILKEK